MLKLCQLIWQFLVAHQSDIANWLTFFVLAATLALGWAQFRRKINIFFHFEQPGGQPRTVLRVFNSSLRKIVVEDVGIKKFDGSLFMHTNMNSKELEPEGDFNVYNLMDFSVSPPIDRMIKPSEISDVYYFCAVDGSKKFYRMYPNGFIVGSIMRIGYWFRSKWG